MKMSAIRRDSTGYTRTTAVRTEHAYTEATRKHLRRIDAQRKSDAALRLEAVKIKARSRVMTAVTILLAIIIGVACFFGGMVFEQRESLKASDAAAMQIIYSVAEVQSFLPPVQ